MQASQDNLIIVLVTCGSDDEALEIANVLVRKHLAACVNIMPVRSIYEWDGKVEDQQEYLLIIKTQKDRFDELSDTVKALHSYNLPEIISFDISKASPDYANWVNNFTSK